MSCFDHRDVIGSITDGQSDFVEIISDNSNNFSLLNRQKSTTDHRITIFSQIWQLFLTIWIANNVSQVSTFYQKSFGPPLSIQFQCSLCKIFECSNNPFRICTIISQYFKMRLNKVATFSNIFSSFHLISRQHPNLNFWININLLALIKSLMVSGTSSWSLSRTAVAPIK